MIVLCSWEMCIYIFFSFPPAQSFPPGALLSVPEVFYSRWLYIERERGVKERSIRARRWLRDGPMSGRMDGTWFLPNWADVAAPFFSSFFSDTERWRQCGDVMPVLYGGFILAPLFFCPSGIETKWRGPFKATLMARHVSRRITTSSSNNYLCAETFLALSLFLSWINKSPCRHTRSGLFQLFVFVKDVGRLLRERERVGFLATPKDFCVSLRPRNKTV